MNDWEDVMQKHAKSFYLASLFFPKKLMPRVKALYALCRWLDDAVDEAESPKLAEKALLEISDDLQSSDSQLAVNQIYKSSQLSLGYMEDLIQGAKDDLLVVRIQNKQELLQYSYKVAGAVGLAMFDLMKVKDPGARAHAVDLGIAMQITNICRDFKEDLERERVYFPIDLLEHHGVDTTNLFNGNINENNLREATKEMLALADLYYASAQMAFKTIPWRTRGAIIIAAGLYKGIGDKLKRQGANPMNGRTYLNVFEKCLVVGNGVLRWIVSPLTSDRSNHNSTLHIGLEPWQALRGFKR